MEFCTGIWKIRPTFYCKELELLRYYILEYILQQSNWKWNGYKYNYSSNKIDAGNAN